MAAPKGNQFWKARTKHGRDKIFTDKTVLWEACCEYFAWCEENPLYEMKAWHSNGQILTQELPKMRAMTISGLCLFLGITHVTWREYAKSDDFSKVIHHAEQIIYTQKFTGAAADLLNANIIARDLGLKDKQELSSDPENPLYTEIKLVPGNGTDPTKTD